MYLSLYRKYRPQTFDEVIGQDHIIKTLQNQIKEDKISHAYLFCGSRGTGKTSTAKIFAREINCLNPSNGHACGKCESCTTPNNIDVLEIDAASNNGVDEIRDLREKVKYPPVIGKYKVYIIDEVHMLSINAFNALLKTLEEPPEHVVFILATTEVHKLPATILSRCMRFDFKLVSVEDLSKQLEKICDDSKIKYSKQAINMLARAGEGSVRDTLSIADRCISFCGNNLTADAVAETLGVSGKETLYNIANNILQSNIGESLVEVDKVLTQGKSPLVLSKDLINYFRDLLYIVALPKNKAKEIVVANSEDYIKMEALGTSSNYSKIVSAISTLSEVEAELRYSALPRVVLECVIVKILNQINLNERITAIEQKLQNGVNIVEKPAKNIEKQSETVKTVTESELTPIKNNETTSNQILGDLLQELKKEKAMSMVVAISQVKKLSHVDDGVVLEFGDNESIELIMANKNKKIIDKFFEERGMPVKFLTSKQVRESQSTSGGLNKLFGTRLKVE